MVGLVSINSHYKKIKCGIREQIRIEIPTKVMALPHDKATSECVLDWLHWKMSSHVLVVLMTIATEGV